MIPGWCAKANSSSGATYIAVRILTTASISFRLALAPGWQLCGVWNPLCARMDRSPTELYNYTATSRRFGVFNSMLQWTNLPSTVYIRHTFVNHFGKLNRKPFGAPDPDLDPYSGPLGTSDILGSLRMPPGTILGAPWFF